MIIKPKAAQETCPASGSASNVSKATCVMITVTGSTNRIVTLTTADEAAVIGSATFLGPSQNFIEKDPTDELWVNAGTDTQMTKVALK